MKWRTDCTVWLILVNPSSQSQLTEVRAPISAELQSSTRTTDACKSAMKTTDRRVAYSAEAAIRVQIVVTTASRDILRPPMLWTQGSGWFESCEGRNSDRAP